MKNLLSTTLLVLAFAATAAATDFYATPAGSGGTCSQASPCSALTAFANHANMGPGDTLYLCGPDAVNTFVGKFVSTLDGGTVRSCPGKWAIIDGNKTTTLSSGINDSVGTFDIASTVGLSSAMTIKIDDEVMQVASVDDANTISVVRAWNGTSAASHTGGASVRFVGNQLYVSGSNTTYRDFEITHSLADRVATGAVNGGGVFNIGGSNSFINLVVHDNGLGFFTGSASSNTLLYGNIIYNNGGIGQDGGPGPAGSTYGISMYLENASGYSRVYDNFLVNCFSNNLQAFGVTGPYVNGDIRNSVFANAGVHHGDLKRNMIYGPDSQQSPTANVQDNFFYHSPGTSSYSVTFGYGAGIATGSFTNNTLIGSGTGFEVQAVTNLTFTGNRFYSSNSGDIYTLAGTSGYTWNNNTYYSTTTQNRFAQAGVGNFNFTNWKAIYSYDAASTTSSPALPDGYTLLPNTYETGRANLIVTAASGATSINVNLSTTGLNNGQAYTVKNVFDWNGGDVMTGTYNSASPTVSVPLNGEADDVATPTGHGSTPATTCPNLCLMVVMPGAQTLPPVSAKIEGQVRLGGGVRLQE